MSDCCLVKDEDNIWVTKWMQQHQSFCQWICSSVKCGSHDENNCTCQSPYCKYFNCSSMNCCQHSSTSKGCCQWDSICQCLGLRKKLNSLWDLSCCKCAKDNENILCCKRNNEKYQCLICNGVGCDSDKYTLNNCLINGNGCICSQPVHCPTFEIELSSRMKGVTVCPFCPENILCFECNETEAIRCCCHYVFLNRCGDPDFKYEDPKEAICIWNRSSCCTYLLELFVQFCQAFCVGCYTVCENSVKCCGYSCFTSMQLLTCQCSNVDFCSKFSFLCFDCNKLEHSSNEMVKIESEMSKCGCCIFKHEPVEVQHAMEEVASLPSMEYGQEQDRIQDGINSLLNGNSLSESQFRQICQVMSTNGNISLLTQIMPNFEQNTDQGRRLHSSRSLPNHRRFSRSESASFHGKEEDNIQNIISHLENIRQSASPATDKHKDYSSDEGYDLEDESHEDVRNIEKHQRQLLSNSFHYEEETESDVGKTKASGHRKWDSVRTTGSNVSQGKALKGKDHTVRSGILKNHSKYYDDYDSCDDSDNGESVREMKHAHFEDEDPELYRELFPGRQRISDERQTARQTGHTSKLSNRRKKLVKRRHVDLSSDESDVADKHKTRKRKASQRDPSSSDDEPNSSSRASNYGTNRSRNDRLNMSDRQAHIIDQNQTRRNLSRERLEVTNGLQEDIESDIDTPSYIYLSKKSNRSRKKSDRSPRHNFRKDAIAVPNDEEEDEVTDHADAGRTYIHKLETTSRKKSLADRMKKMRERNHSDSSESSQSSSWV